VPFNDAEILQRLARQSPMRAAPLRKSYGAAKKAAAINVWLSKYDGASKPWIKTSRTVWHVCEEPLHHQRRRSFDSAISAGLSPPVPQVQLNWMHEAAR